MKTHPKPRTPRSLRQEPPPAGRALLDHVLDRLEGSPADLEACGLAAAPRVTTAAGGDLAGLADRLRRRQDAFARERAAAPRQLADLLALPEEERRARAATDPAYHRAALCQLLLAEGRARSLAEPREGEGLAELALDIARRLDPGTYGGEVPRDLRARAWCEAANARRLGSDLDGAEAAFGKAEALLRESRDPMEKARYRDLLATLRKDQRRFHDSLRLRRRAAATYRRLGQPHLLGCTLNNMANTFLDMGEPGEAAVALREAVQRIDPEIEPRALFCARHNLALALAEAGRFEAAERAFAEFQEMYRRFPDPAAQNRRSWLAGRIAAGLGRFAEAEAALRAVRDGFLMQGIAYDVALVSLDLAALYARQGRAAEVRKLAEEMMPIFASRQIHREALAALGFFRQAAEREAVTVETVRRVASFLKRFQGDPGLCFEEAGKAKPRR